MIYKNTQHNIMKELQSTMKSISDEEVYELINKIKSADKVFFVGVGRVLLSLQAVAKRFAHLSIDTVVVGEITEPAITKNDLLIVGSGSGESTFPLAIAKKAKSFKAEVVHIGSNPESSMKEHSNHFIRIPVQTKLDLPEEIPSIQPMTSLFEQSLLLLGDTLALIMIEEDELDVKNLWQYHANLE